MNRELHALATNLGVSVFYQPKELSPVKNDRSVCNNLFLLFKTICYIMTVFEIVVARLVSPNQVEMIGLGALVGLIMHHGFFRYGEWHLYVPTIILNHALVFTCLLAISNYCEYFANHPFGQASTLISIGYLTALFTSIAVYRLLFHRLTDFPGPLFARVTKLWHVWACRGSQNHLVLDKLHRKYGDFVRTGKGQHYHIELSQLTVFQVPARSQYSIPTSSWSSMALGQNA